MEQWQSPPFAPEIRPEHQEYNRPTNEVSYGRVPAGSIMMPSVLPAPDGSHSLYCVVIIKQVDEKARGRVSLNELLWD